jgi:NADH:ubiquinone oxidoreductase subunit 6 (subunit J)
MLKVPFWIFLSLAILFLIIFAIFIALYYNERIPERRSRTQFFVWVVALILAVIFGVVALILGIIEERKTPVVSMPNQMETIQELPRVPQQLKYNLIRVN